MQKRLPKSRRAPEAVVPLGVTERSLTVIRALARHRFLSTSLLVRLAGGNEDVTHRHLQSLYHRGVVSRLTIPCYGQRGEFVYFLEDASAVRALAPRLGIDVDFEEIRLNRERYSEAALSATDGVGRFLFMRHELMISAFRASLEIACRDSVGRVELPRFEVGSGLWHRVRLSPTLTLPFRPDGLLTLRLMSAAEGQQRANFFYEADRNTSTLPRFQQKLEAYTHFLKNGRQEKAFGMRTVRAVLIETTTTQRLEQLRASALTLAAKEPLAKLLFWFTCTKEETDKNPFHPHWHGCMDGPQKSLLD